MAEEKIVAMSEDKQIYEPSDAVKLKAYIKNMDEYRKLYQRSTTDLKGFWGECAEQLDWYKKWDKILEWDFNKPEVKWFLGGKLNASYNCLDRHLNTWRSNKVALIWQGASRGEQNLYVSAAPLPRMQVCQCAEEVWSEEGGSSLHLSPHDPGTPDCYVSLCPDRSHS